MIYCLDVAMDVLWDLDEHVTVLKKWDRMNMPLFQVEGSTVYMIYDALFQLWGFTAAFGSLVSKSSHRIGSEDLGEYIIVAVYEEDYAG